MLSVAESSRASAITPRRRYARIPKSWKSQPDRAAADFVRLVRGQGLRELFDEISPIKDFTGKVMELHFLDYEFGAPKYAELECRTKDLTFGRPCTSTSSS